MRLFLLLSIFLIAFVRAGNAQTTIVTRREIPAPANARPIPIDETTLVKDSAGVELTYKVWQPLLLSGDYAIRSSQYGTDKPTYLLRKLSPAEKLHFAKLRKPQPQNGAGPDVPSVAGTSGVQPANAVPFYRKPQKSTSFTEGELMETFKERDINGNKIDLKLLRGKIVVINFWFITCPACRDEMPELDRLTKEYAADTGVVFIAISLDPKWKVKDFLKTTPFGYQQISDGRYYCTNNKIDLYPTNVVLDKNGLIKFSSVGSDHTGYWLKKTIVGLKAEN